jgi:hypothetical protein
MQRVESKLIEQKFAHAECLPGAAAVREGRGRVSFNALTVMHYRRMMTESLTIFKKINMPEK